MVTYEGLFQFSLVLLTALLVAAAFTGRNQKSTAWVLFDALNSCLLEYIFVRNVYREIRSSSRRKSSIPTY